MLQSRFFHSSLQELQLHIKEIYSLQDQLRQRVISNATNPKNKIKIHEVNFTHQGSDAIANTATIESQNLTHEITDSPNSTELRFERNNIRNDLSIDKEHSFNEEVVIPKPISYKQSDAQPKLDTPRNKIGTKEKLLGFIHKTKDFQAAILIFLLWEMVAVLFLILIIF